MVKRILRYIESAALLCLSRCISAAADGAVYDDATAFEWLGLRRGETSNIAPAPVPAFASPIGVPTSDSRQLDSGMIRPSTTAALPQTCTFDPNVFEATVVAEAYGYPDEFDLPQQMSVEAIIKQSYNDLAKSAFCDGLVREVFNVTVSLFGFEEDATFVIARRSRALVDKTRRRFFFRFFVTGTCRECPRDTKLFTDAVQTRRWLESIHERVLQGMGVSYENGSWGNRPQVAGPNIFEVRSGDSYGLVNPDTISEHAPVNPTASPTSSPTDSPTASPTSSPIESPTASPTSSPTASPTPAPVATISSRRSCDCDDTLPDRSPNTSEFAEKFNLTVNEDVSVTSIEEITGVAEVEEVNCTDEVEEFDSQALMDATGNVTLLTDDDFIVLGEAFISTYNELAGRNCDPFFRVGVNATVILEEVFVDDEDDDEDVELITGSFADNFNEVVNDAVADNGSLRRGLRRNGSKGNARSLSNPRGRSFRFRFAVRGRCVDCRRDMNLFDDTNADRRLGRRPRGVRSSSIQTRHLGFLSDDGVCYCAPNAPQLGPETGDFTVTFNNDVQDLEDRGRITQGAVEKIEETIQVDDTLPSSMPSMEPTIAPSREPSSSPSAAPSSPPSESPSGSPTIAESDVPTATPSVSPTGMPSDTPSVSPTGMPSGTPSVAPTSSPSESPSAEPSVSPTGLIPTESPMPSPSPSTYPTDRPSSSPSNE